MGERKVLVTVHWRRIKKNLERLIKHVPMRGLDSLLVLMPENKNNYLVGRRKLNNNGTMPVPCDMFRSVVPIPFGLPAMFTVKLSDVLFRVPNNNQRFQNVEGSSSPSANFCYVCAEKKRKKCKRNATEKASPNRLY